MGETSRFIDEEDDSPEATEDALLRAESFVRELGERIGETSETSETSETGRTDPYQEERLQECVQHLRDLGYIRSDLSGDFDSETGSARFAASEAERALARLRAEDPELAQAPLDPRTGIYPTNAGAVGSLAAGPDEAAPVEAGAFELRRLSELTSLEGEFVFPRPPERGERSVYTRVLHHRLRLLGLYGGDAAAPFSEATEYALRALGFALGIEYGAPDVPRNVGKDGSERALYDLIGDARALTKRFLLVNESQPLVYRDPTSREDGKYRYASLKIIEGRFEHDSLVYRVIQRYMSKKEPEKDEYDYEDDEEEELSGALERLNNRYNRLGLRLLQLRLWMLGFYEGLLDGWNAGAALALQEALEFAELDDEKNVLVGVEDGCTAVNPDYVWELLFERLETARDPAAYEEALSLEADALDAKTLTEREGEFRDAAGMLKARRRNGRAYYGERTLLHSAIMALRRGFSWLGKKALALLRKLAAPVVNLVRYVYRKAREGLLLAKQSLARFFHFIRGRPVYTMHLDPKGERVLSAWTKFYLDADVMQFCERNAPPEAISQHLESCRALTRGVALCLTTAARLLRLLLALKSGPIGWIKIAFEIGRIVFAVIRESQKEAAVASV